MPLPNRLPNLYLGTMTFGWNQASSFVDATVAASFLRRFAAWPGPVMRLDTARIYSGGDTEPIVRDAIAAVGASMGPSFRIGTKAHPSQPGGLSADGLRRQLDASLAALGVDHFEEYYLHQPDPSADLLESLKVVDGFCKEGTVKRVGMSNYHASEVARAFALCDAHGLTKPSVNQGL